MRPLRPQRSSTPVEMPRQVPLTTGNGAWRSFPAVELMAITTVPILTHRLPTSAPTRDCRPITTTARFIASPFARPKVTRL